MVSDIIIDTHILVEIIQAYNSKEPLSQLNLKRLPIDVSNQINGIISNKGDYGYVVSSALGFVEIANQFEKISDGKFDEVKFKGFVAQPPSWFLIEPISLECIRNLHEIDSYVIVDDKVVPIEINDAIHAATVLTRDKYNALMGTEDKRLRFLPCLKNKVLH